MVNFERPLPADDQPPRITELWAWTIVDPLTDVEGIIALRRPGRAFPLVGSMRRTMEAMKPWADAIAQEAETTAMLRRFVPADDDSAR